MYLLVASTIESRLHEGRYILHPTTTCTHKKKEIAVMIANKMMMMIMMMITWSHRLILNRQYLFDEPIWMVLPI